MLVAVAVFPPQLQFLFYMHTFSVNKEIKNYNEFMLLLLSDHWYFEAIKCHSFARRLDTSSQKCVVSVNSQ